MNIPIWHRTAAPAEQAQALAQAIVLNLQTTLRERDTARLAVSGGRSPVLLLEALSRSPLPWSRITVSLVDERCVPPTSPDSNTALVRQHLLQREAAAARFSPPQIEPRQPLPANDVIVLGMGTDGHTASLFPDDPNLEQALDLSHAPGYLKVSPASSPWQRLTLNLSAIIQARHLYVAIAGITKRQVLEQALAGRPGLPIGTVLAASIACPRLHWCPDTSQS